MSGIYQEPGNIAGLDNEEVSIHQEQFKARQGFLAPITLNELLAMEIPPMTWALPNTLPIPGLVAISSKPGVGKTNLITWILWQIGKGIPVFRTLEGDNLGFLTQPENYEPIKSLMVQEETSELIIQNRVKGFKGTPPGEMINFMFFKGFKLSSPADVQALKNILIEKKIKVVVLDPFSSVLGVESENDNAEVSKIMDVMRALVTELVIGIYFLHHPAKGEDDVINLRGAGDILGKVDVHITLDVVSSEQRDVLKVSYEKLRIADSRHVSNFKVQMVGNTDMGDFEFIYAGKEGGKKEKTDHARRDILAALLGAQKAGDQKTRTQLFKDSPELKNNDKYRGAFDKAVEDGLIKKAFGSETLVLTANGEKWLKENDPLFK